MAPPPLPPDEAARLAALERWRKDHEAQHVRERSEIRREVEDMNAAAVRHVERAVTEGLEPVRVLAGDVAVIKAQNAAQTEILSEAAAELRLARDERIKRAAAEELLAKQKTEADEQRRRVKEDTDLEIAKKDARTRWRGPIIIAVVTAFGTVIVTLIAAILSHR